jgi:hypothetical protein
MAHQKKSVWRRAATSCLSRSHSPLLLLLLLHPDEVYYALILHELLLRLLTTYCSW